MRLSASSVAEGKERSRGFTLLELVVVLAISSIVLLVGAFAATTAYESARYRGFVRDVMQDLRAVRAQALSSGHPQVYPIDLKRAVVGSEGKERVPPPGVTLDAIIAHTEVLEDRKGGIRFFPDGASTGGSIMIYRGKRAGVRLRVDWLLGRVTLESVDVL